jgi:hypothetical protein
MKFGTEYRTNWIAIAALVPGRVENQCRDRWRDALDPRVDQEARRMGTWTEDEVIKLKDAVQTHGGKNWAAIAALVQGRTKRQCNKRWQIFLDLSIDKTNRRMGTWAEDEDRKLKDAVQTHGVNNWVAIAALVQGRTIDQCRDRWRGVLDHRIDRSTGKWTAGEDIKLKDSVQTHGGKNWDVIVALVEGRTKKHCNNRWEFVLYGRMGRR